MTKKEKIILIFNWVKNVIVLIPLILAFTFIFWECIRKNLCRSNTDSSSRL